MVELIDNLLESFRIGIEDLEWMSEETKKRALIKLEKLNVEIRDILKFGKIILIVWNSRIMTCMGILKPLLNCGCRQP